MGYIFIGLVILLLFLFTYQHLRRFLSESKKQQEKVLKGYYLVSHTYEEKSTNQQSHYYGVFQQGDQSYTLEISLSLFLQLHPPMRGELIAQDGKVQTFS
ncbi:hypothetical protein AEQ18_04385 [Enterococcus sp. RIT-PI-f]|nr:hypothetical protein AEQ18_04385 [Enterococcus sp. RIT-PI-f]